MIIAIAVSDSQDVSLIKSNIYLLALSYMSELFSTQWLVLAIFFYALPRDFQI